MASWRSSINVPSDPFLISRSKSIAIIASWVINGKFPGRKMALLCSCNRCGSWGLGRVSPVGPAMLLANGHGPQTYILRINELIWSTSSSWLWGPAWIASSLSWRWGQKVHCESSSARICGLIWGSNLPIYQDSQLPLCYSLQGMAWG